MKRSFIVLLVAVLTLFAQPAFAGNFYLSGSGGAVINLNAHIDGFDGGLGGNPGDRAIISKNGWSAGGAVGYDFGKFRTEFEYIHNKNDLDNIDISGTKIGVGGATQVANFLIINGLFDIENKSAFTPYFGVGLGLVRLSINEIEVSTNLGPNPRRLFEQVIIDDSAVGFAFKLSAGTAYKMTDHIDLTLNYALLGSPALGFVDTRDVPFEMGYYTHNFNAGIKYNF